ncbi:hypothetical protein BpHYR1_035574 [Brachionus plicatilis]|uniref:Uncharacterized protein n=1 Tax=Brachionus plicatilis TaxID=10195 RepID=A0A3M7PDK7_BRAPC|nr:hypothetical protein BpHYR1_035574 [Brachionus plicatilis]
MDIGRIIELYWDVGQKKNFLHPENRKKHFIFEILSLKEQQLFKGFAIFGTLGRTTPPNVAI